MTARNLLLGLLGATALLVACNVPPSNGDSEAVDLAGSETLSLSSPVEFSRSGGIAGLNDQLTISADGTVEVRGRGGTSEASLSGAELEVLAGLLDRLQASDGEKNATSDGYDLITYTLVYDGETTRADDLTVSEEFRPVLDFLTGLLAR